LKLEVGTLGDEVLKPGEPANLSPRARKFLRLVALGKDVTEARCLTGFSGSRASVLMHCPCGAKYMEEIEEELLAKGIECAAEAEAELQVSEIISKRLEAEAEDTLDQLIRLRDCADEKVSLAATKDILDRAGFKPTDKMQVESKVIATDGLLEALQRASGKTSTSMVVQAAAEDKAGTVTGPVQLVTNGPVDCVTKKPADDVNKVEDKDTSAES